MLRKFFYFLTGLALWPVGAVAVRVFYHLIRANQPTDGSIAILSAPFLAFSGGMAAWLLISMALSGPARAYVLAHELTHALWGLLMGAKVSRLQIKQNSGSVTLSKTNALIVLAPYFFPLYAVLIIVAYAMAGLFVPVEKAQTLWMTAVGFTWGFHLTYTISALSQQQSDIRLYGHVFSYTLILTLNITGMALWVVLTTPVTLAEVALLAQQETLLVGTWLWHGILFLRDYFSDTAWLRQ